MKLIQVRFIRPAALLLAAVACNNAGSDLGPGPLTNHSITTLVFLDRDGSRTFAVGIDTLFPGAMVSLRPVGGGSAVQTVTTSTVGVARFDNVALGEYAINVEPASLGDSILVAEIVTSPVKVEVADTNTVVAIRLSFPEVSIRQARLLPAGKRAFIRGVILAGVQSFRDTTSHIVDSSGQIRLTRVSLRSGIGNTPGDSVSVLGVASTRAGQPTIDLAVISRFGQRPAPIPLPVATGTAATAAGGTLDAGLVIITGALISDTATAAPDYRVVGSDGTGPITVLLDGLINFNRANFRPGRVMNVQGVLVPDGTGAWVLKPRQIADAQVF